MSDVELIRDRLRGKYLLGFMPLEKKDYNIGDWDNAVALYVGTPDNPECYVLRSQNGDYSRYDSWVIEKSKTMIDRDERYKMVSAIIDDVMQHEITQEEWISGNDCFHFTLITKIKSIKFGHYWVDCHYPNSIWEAI